MINNFYTMKKICATFFVAAILITGCANSEGINSASADETNGSFPVEGTGITESESATEIQGITKFEIRGEVFITSIRDSVIYTKDGEEIFAYVFSDDKIKEQSLDTLVCKLDDADTGIKLYWFSSGDTIKAISEAEDKSDTTYVIDENTVILKREAGETESIYKIDIKDAKAEKLQFDFGTDDAAVTAFTAISHDYTKGIAVLQSDSLDCIYYLVDFISMETNSLNELFDIPVYNVQDGVEVTKSRIGFIDDDTIAAAVITDDFCQLIKYSLTDCVETELITIDDCSGADMAPGYNYTLVKYNDSTLIAVDNSSFQVKEYDIRINDSSSFYEIMDGKYAVIYSNILQNQYVISLETGEIISDKLNNNSMFMIKPDGSLFEYDISDNCIVYNE